MANYLSVTEYAAMTGKDPGNIRRMLISGRLKGEKIGHQWIIPEGLAYPKDLRERSGEYKKWRKRVQLNSNKDLIKTIKALANQLADIYGKSLQEVIVYGSYSRGDQKHDSDVDIALMLKKKPSSKTTSKMIDCVASHEIESGKVLSVIDIDLKKYEKWKEVLPFYANIEKEGISVWKEA